MDTKLIISLEDFPEEGLHVEGELDGALFGLDNDDARSVGPLSYALDIQIFDEEFLAQGDLSAPFEFCCNRCLKPFRMDIEALRVALSENCSNRLSIDLTESMREEIVLNLPDYPKCEMIEEECKINCDFSDFSLDNDPHLGVDSSTRGGNSVWDALNDLSDKGVQDASHGSTDQ